MAPRRPRPRVDERIDEVLASRLSRQQHRCFWYAHSPELGETPPYEALQAGKREEVLELAMGRPGADRSVVLISPAEGRRIRELYGHLSPPYEL